MSTKTSNSDIIPSIIAGSVNGIIFVISAMALSALIFTGPLAPYLPQGIGMVLVASVVFALFSAFTSKQPALQVSSSLSGLSSHT